MAFGGVVSITLGGLLADLSWRAPFLLYLFSLVVLPMVLGFLWEPHREAPMGKVQASASPLPRSKVILIYLAGFFGMMMFYAIPTQVPFYLENSLEVSPTVSGLAIASTTLAAATISYHYPKLRRRLSFPLIYTYAFSVMSLGFLSLGFADSIGLVVPALFVCGLGAGVTIPNANLWLISITPERWRGRLMGGLTSAIFVGQFVSPLALTPFRNWLSVALLFELLAPLVLCVGLAFLGFDYAQRQAPQRVPE
jgi:MFS family permease